MNLSDVIADCERGVFPPSDGQVTVLPAPKAGMAAVLAFTAHSVVAADVDAGWVAANLPAGDLSAPLCPPFLTALTDRLGLRVNNVDIVCVAEPLGKDALDAAPELRVEETNAHPRVWRALQYRDDVSIWATPGGILTIGLGLAGRHEVAIELDAAAQGHGIGRDLAYAARALTDRPLWAQIAPGNAASVRAFLAAGYRPVGAEALLVSFRTE